VPGSGFLTIWRIDARPPQAGGGMLRVLAASVLACLVGRGASPSLVKYCFDSRDPGGVNGSAAGRYSSVSGGQVAVNKPLLGLWLSWK
jgi:hypothetical protein